MPRPAPVDSYVFHNVAQVSEEKWQLHLFRCPASLAWKLRAAVLLTLGLQVGLQVINLFS